MIPLSGLVSDIFSFPVFLPKTVRNIPEIVRDIPSKDLRLSVSPSIIHPKNAAIRGAVVITSMANQLPTMV